MSGELCPISLAGFSEGSVHCTVGRLGALSSAYLVVVVVVDYVDVVDVFVFVLLVHVLVLVVGLKCHREASSFLVVVVFVVVVVRDLDQSLGSAAVWLASSHRCSCPRHPRRRHRRR